MTRELLLEKICPMSRVYDCCIEDGDYDCDNCKRLTKEWLDEYDKQIRADAIDDFKNKLIKIIKLREESHFYDISEHEYEWLISDIMYSAKKLKE